MNSRYPWIITSPQRDRQLPADRRRPPKIPFTTCARCGCESKADRKTCPACYAPLEEATTTAYELRRHLQAMHDVNMTGADYGTLLAVHDTEHHTDTGHVHDHDGEGDG